MDDEINPVRVRLDGVEFWWQRKPDNSGALAPIEHCNENGAVEGLHDGSFAYVMSDGSVVRFEEEIGRREDMEILG